MRKPLPTSLSFEEKSRLNRHLLDLLKLKLVDKESALIDWPGQRYYFDDPANSSLMGSIGPLPNPDFSGPQPPNSMGMVLLTTASTEGVIELSVSGQFDLVHRCIPELRVMVADLKKHEGLPKKTQPIATAYRRFTVCFEGVQIRLELPEAINQWVKPPQGNALSQAMTDLESQLLNDPTIFKCCFLGKTGAAVVDFPWEDDIIVDQASLNQVVNNAMFDRKDQVLPYQVVLRARARRAPVSMTEVKNAFLVEIFLENQTCREVAKQFGVVNSAHLLDVSFSTDLKAGDAHVLPHKLSPVDYRYQPDSTVPSYGITTSVYRDSEGVFRTDAMPVSAQVKTVNPDPVSIGMPGEPLFAELAKNPVPLLDALVVAVNHYAESWDALIQSLRDDGDHESARVAEDDQAALRQEAKNMANGVALLAKHPQLRHTFSWMNEVMEKAFNQQGKHIKAWRLFQLGFILTQVQAVYERSCPESELTDHLNTAEVLWFATGGGKTEAYLGIVIMSMLYERLQGRPYGVTAWMKFPLRMLSVQQFQRLSYVIAQANLLKQREELPGHPFTIGYFTGSGTPREISSAFDSYRDSFLPNVTHDQLQCWKFIHDCPYCDAQDSVVIQKDMSRSRVLHTCSNSSCWTNARADAGQYGEGLRGEIGIYISGEEVYRYIPTVMVGTIDKLAVIGHNRRFRMFFGGATHFCPDHGFITEGKCHHNRLVQQDDGSYRTEACGNNSRTSDVKTHALRPAVMPGVQFLLQDELHLLSQNTGNFDAHYESAMQAIQVANGGRPSKVLSATATIQGYESHIHHLYLRKARRFPVPGVERGESFYSRLDPNGLVQRWYAGILPLLSGRQVERASAIASMRFLTLVDELRTGLIDSPEVYTEKLGLATELAIPAKHHIEEYLNTCLIYNNSIRGNGYLHGALEDCQKDSYPDREWQKLDGQTNLEDIQKTIQLIETKSPDHPVRQIIATSVVSHGVDMHRLNFMILAGWPKSIAEYMQASARSGRVEPGVVLSVMNSRQLFQNNVFLDFQDYHRFMDRLVESVPINRFAPNLLERTLPGVLSACVLNWMEGQSWGKDAGKKAQKLKELLSNSANGAYSSLHDIVSACLAVPEEMRGEFDSRVLDDYQERLDKELGDMLKKLNSLPSNLSDLKVSDAIAELRGYGPMRNLRDIESQLTIKPYEDAAVKVINSLGRKRF